MHLFRLIPDSALATHQEGRPPSPRLYEFTCVNPDDMNYKTLAERVRHLKYTKEGVAKMSRIMEEVNAIFWQDEIKASIVRMLEDGKLSKEDIALYLNTTVENVSKVEAELLQFA